MSLIIPPWVVPREESHEWLDELSSVFQPEFAPGASQRQSYGSMRLKIDRSHTVRGEELAVLESTLLAADGRSALVYARAPYRLMTGSIAAVELIPNNTFASGSTGFTADNSEVVVSVASRALRVRRTSIAFVSGVIVSPITVSTSADTRYVFRIFIRRGVGNIDLNFKFGTTAGGSEIGITSAITEPGFYEVSVGTTASTTMHISIRDNVTGKLVDDYFDIPFISLSRCLFISSASQIGSYVTVGLGTANTNDLLLPGDWVSMAGQTYEAGCELKLVTQALTLNSSTSGRLHFKPQLFRSPVDNSAVVCSEPFGKFLVSDLKIKNRLGVEADVSYTLEQVYD